MTPAPKDLPDTTTQTSEASPLIREKLDRMREEVHSAMQRSRAQLERIRNMLVALQFEDGNGLNQH